MNKLTYIIIIIIGILTITGTVHLTDYKEKMSEEVIELNKFDRWECDECGRDVLMNNIMTENFCKGCGSNLINSAVHTFNICERCNKEINTPYCGSCGQKQKTQYLSDFIREHDVDLAGINQMVKIRDEKSIILIGLSVIIGLLNLVSLVCIFSVSMPFVETKQNVLKISYKKNEN